MGYVIRTINILVDTIVLFFVASIVFFAGYNIWDSHQIYDAASSNKFQEYQPQAYDPNEKKSIDERFINLQKQNPDVFGWIHLFDTQINYPMVQGKTNQQYLNLDPLKRFSLSGSIFLDSNTPNDFSQYVSIVYGHHMEKHKMFGDLDLYREESYARKHSKGNLYYQGAYHGFDVVTFIDTDAYDSNIYLPQKDEVAFQSVLDYLGKKGFYQLMDVTLKDRLVMLSTCADGTDKRHIVVVKLKDTAYQEPKRKVHEQNTSKKIVKKYWWITITIIPLALVIVVYLLWNNNRREDNDNENEKVL